MRALKFGVFDEGGYNWFDHVPNAVDAYEQSFREVQLEELVGFDYHFFIEHQGHVVGQLQSPAVYLAALSQRTSTIRIGAMVFILPFHDPLRLAMDCAMIDQLSHGRFEFGAGLSFSSDMFKAWHIPYSFDERRQAGPEALEVITKAWSEERFSFHGKYFQYDNVIPLPRPYQDPHPPMWFAGSTASSLELCVERGFGVGFFLLPDDVLAQTIGHWHGLWQQARKSEPRPPCFLSRSVYVAETDEQAYEEVAAYLPQSYSWGEEKFGIEKIGDHDMAARGHRDPKQEMFLKLRSGIDAWIEQNIAYVGSPETVIAKIEASRATLGYDVFGGRFRFGPMPDTLVERSIELFGRKVIPAFR